MDKDRLNHSYAVAKKMMQTGQKLGLSREELKELFVIGLNHDIGYEFSENGVNHNKIGGEILKNSGFRFWKEVYYHGILTTEFSSMYLDILNYADMQIDKFGNDVGFGKRLEDIEKRYGKDSIVLNRCKELINDLKKRVLNLEIKEDDER